MTLVNEEYMNEPKPHPNESDPENGMVKKSLKELKVTTYTNNMQLPFWWLNRRNSKVKRDLPRTIQCWMTSYEFS